MWEPSHLTTYEPPQPDTEIALLFLTSCLFIQEIKNQDDTEFVCFLVIHIPQIFILYIYIGKVLPVLKQLSTIP